MFKNWAVWNKDDIRRVLGLTIKREHSAITILNKFHKKLGYKPEVARKEGARGQQERIWKLSNYRDRDRDVILEALSRKYGNLPPNQEPEMYQRDTVATTFSNNPSKKVMTTVQLKIEKEVDILSDLSLKVGSIVTRVGALGQWVIQAIADKHASIKQIDGWGFANSVPLEQLSLLGMAIA
jgi:hypothetical protein